MRQKTILIITVIITLLTFNSLSSLAQKLLNSRSTSPFTYIYKIKNTEAKTIYKNEIWQINDSYYHTLVDSFPTKDIYEKKLPFGHYLKIFAEENEQKISISTIQNFEVFIVKNNTDLLFQVFDLNGNLISNADVRINKKKLYFDDKSNSYLDKKSNQKGLLSVTHNGFTAYSKLSRKYNNSGFNRVKRKIIYGTPLKYAWTPVNYIIHLPIDGYKSIKNSWAQGTIASTKQFFVRLYEIVACLFDDYHCNDYYGDSFEDKHEGYLVFSKPKYQPNDTVKFKSYLTNKKGKAINKPVHIVLRGYGKKIKFPILQAYRNGAYESQFVLHDSLQLQLDRDYTLSLETENLDSYISNKFKYEEYELSSTHLKLRLNEKTHYKNQSLSLFVKGTDENDLNLQDAEIELTITTLSLDKYFSNHVFIPDTLIHKEQKLEPSGETEILIHDSIFPKANFSYQIKVKMLSSENEAKTETEEREYKYFTEEFVGEIIADSIQFKCLKNGLSIKKQANVFSLDNFGNRNKINSEVTPFRIALSPYYNSYILESDSISNTVDISEKSAMLQCYSERTSDSIKIQIVNPRKIPFTYHIYQHKKEKERGYNKALLIHKQINSKQNYFVCVNYMWAGEMKQENYKIPLMDKQLTISVLQPKIVYPGQESQIELTVTNENGKPVEGVDLTAYALTKKFNYSAPSLPYLGKQRKDKTIINQFSNSNTHDHNSISQSLNYNTWKALADLDSIEYYRFIYPEKEVYRSEYQTNDSVTQFAPFVFKNGQIDPIHVIYIDRKPVYFSWSTNMRPYSFAIDSGYHQIKLRTTDKIITMDSVSFKKGYKQIISLDEDLSYHKVRIQNTGDGLTYGERRTLYNYIFPYRNSFGDRLAYLEQEDNVQLLTPSRNKHFRNHFAGPINGELTFNLIDSFSTNFKHERFFEYDFAPNLLKMREANSNNRYPKILTNINPEIRLNDSVLSKSDIMQLWREKINQKRSQTPRYTYPRSTSSGAGRLKFTIQAKQRTTENTPLNLLLFRYDNHEFLRVYPGNTSIIHQLKPGFYKLLFFYPGSKYNVIDSLNIQANGLNYYQFDEALNLKKDSFSKKVNSLIEKTVFKPKPFLGEEQKELKNIFNSYQNQYHFTGDGEYVEGYVTAVDDGLELPGVTVIIKGTTFGTVTDIDGHYRLKIPYNNTSLLFSFVGMRQQEKQVGYEKYINVSLEYENLAMDEVVVVGYGISRKSVMTASSIVSVSPNSLNKGIPGVSGNISQTLQGRVAGVQINSQGSGVSISIRGATTLNFNNKPLYIINGQIFDADISELDQNSIANIQVLKDKSATALYGARAANGVVIIDTQNGAFKSTNSAKTKGADYNQEFYESASQASSIRNNFSDVAFWQPNLITNKKGKATFKVRFPDDVTSWDTFFLAMNGNKQTGQSQDRIKSYKPLMAKLSVPRFMVETDTCLVHGKALNYTSDSIHIKTKFELNDSIVSQKSGYCVNSTSHNLPLIAYQDSISLKYVLDKEDGYFDGELKSIPVYPMGLKQSKSSFHVLDRDTTLQLDFDEVLGKVKLYAQADVLEVIKGEINHLINYKYLCNEQIASKLKALMSELHIKNYKNEKFKSNRKVQKLIKLLGKNQKRDGLWGWWKNSSENKWISLHVLEAILQTEANGFKNDINQKYITDRLVWQLEETRGTKERIQILRIMRLLNAQINYGAYINSLEKKKLDFNSKLHIMELKQMCNLPYQIDSLKNYQQSTLFGNLFYTDTCKSDHLLNNDIQNTILAYRISKRDSSTNNSVLRKIRNYFFESRKETNWRNTYESAQIIETILPDLLQSKGSINKAKIIFSGDINKSITKFPFSMVIDPSKKITVNKSGDFPVYIGSSQTFWNASPLTNKGDFEINTYFKNNTSNQLMAGKEVTLTAKVKLKKDAEYLMINIPVPGGCSYAEKKNSYWNESHREYYKNETAIFCQQLKKGEYTFEIKLLPRYTGNYQLNPAKIAQMYFPIFNANNEAKRVIIK
ncbi:carboxypeptidase-like regulatory domain-containing protein [Labilibaculum sp. DW002]|uniref:Carboxypeptidase-like regulatory domain-containing protein n=1 Tax=Paralabilibaculum antarcticum TaxID=2912572 RepID=A0ABT5VW66_9BACT|nr:carboxypeptidase-like regulatory domain-containing protein [Labilibaculum sp. DW002]MDE5419647.1 carboxypeptidase-like regulatory domain-containing protein [Labilibaculum sp. DW002]